MTTQIQEISFLINNLTEDNDLRQELWVHYLSGNSSDSFSQKLQDVYRHAEYHQVAETIWYMINHGNVEFKELLEGFSELEQSIMCLLALGMNISEISKYKSLSIIRVEQVVSTIKNNSKWNK